MTERAVWILNHYAGTPDEPGPTRHIDLAKRLVERGFRVTLVASSRRSIQGDAARPEREREKANIYGGVRCVWLRSKARARGNDGSRIVNMLEFAFRLWREGRTRFRGVAPYPDVIIGSTPHLFTPFVGWLLARRFRARFVVEVRDLWPETFVALGFYGPWHPIVLGLRVLERFLYRRADHIVTLLPEGWRYFAERAGVAKEDVSWIPNGASPGSVPSEDERPGRPFTFMYMGSEGRANALDDLLAASRILQDRGAAVRVVLVGDGKERGRLEEEAHRLSLGNVTFVDAVPKKDVARLVLEADAFVALLEKTPLYRYGISLNKLFEYMAAGRPVVLAGETAHNYVALAKCGLVIPPRDPGALAGAMAELAALPSHELRAMGQRGLDYVRAHHDWDLLADRFARVLADAVTGWEGAQIRSLGARIVKRALDVAVALPLLALCLPPLAVMALAIKLDGGGPVFFRQERVGRRGARFRVWKFRTMVVDAVSKGLGVTVAAGDERITRVGRHLRDLGLDELPQFLNVLKGEMSLVGPRPTLSYQVERYDAAQRRRLEVRPGITSLAVVSGRNALTWKERIELDVWYIDHWSLGLDLRVLFRTLWCVLVTREGLYGKDGVNDPFVDSSGEGGSDGATD